MARRTENELARERGIALIGGAMADEGVVEELGATLVPVGEGEEGGHARPARARGRRGSACGAAQCCCALTCSISYISARWSEITAGAP